MTKKVRRFVLLRCDGDMDRDPVYWDGAEWTERNYARRYYEEEVMEAKRDAENYAGSAVAAMEVE